jgi:calcineurin-like phosphoesterase family protein
MDRGLIRNWNRSVTRRDTVYHLGDFCFARKSNIRDDMRIYGEAMHMVRGRVIFLRGNHDNALQHADYFIYSRIDGINVFMRHWPPWVYPRRFPHYFYIPSDVDLVLCGHVHDKWRYRVYSVGQRGIPVVNVGTDVWGYEPVSFGTIIKEVFKC